MHLYLLHVCVMIRKIKYTYTYTYSLVETVPSVHVQYVHWNNLNVCGLFVLWVVSSIIYTVDSVD